MTTPVRMFVQAIDGGAALAMSILVVALVARSASGFRRDEGAYLGAATILLSVGFGASTAVAVAGGFSGGLGGNLALPLLGLSLVVPLIVGVIIASTSPAVRRVISRSEVQPGFIAVHALRFIQGSVFIAMVPLGVLPAIFALQAGIGDVIVGLGALPASRWISTGRRGRVVWWNLFGLVDLANATVLGVATVPGVNLLHTTPTSALLVASPLSIIPTFCVPIYVLLHLISLRFLASSRSVARVSPVVKLEASA